MAIYGVPPYGTGTPAVAQDGGGVPLKNALSAEQDGSRRIDPATKDYVLDSTTGRIKGMTDTQQLVYLAVSTTKGTSSMRGLGQELMFIDRITSNFARRVDSTLRACVQHIVDRGLIEVVGTQVDILGTQRPGVARAVLKWRDISSGNEEQTLIPLQHSGPS